MLSINLARLAVSGLGDLSVQLVEKVRTSALTDITNSVQYKTLETLAVSYQENLTKKRGSSYTAQVEEKDAERDEAISALKMAVNTYLKSKDEEKKNAAKRLSAILSQFADGIEKLKYTYESQKIRTLLLELKKTENVADITKINAMEWVESLEITQTEFEGLVVERQDDKKSIKEVDSASSTRKELQVAISNLLKFIDNAAGFKGTAELLDFVEAVQIVLDEAEVKAKTKGNADNTKAEPAK